MKIAAGIKDIKKVSVHGGHSGQFCHHAQDSLEDVIQAYIAQGFDWVGITEHMPPVSDGMCYPDEVQAGIKAQDLEQQFIEYFQLCRNLQEKYSAQIEILTAFETETYTHSTVQVKHLMAMLKPDYLVGSVHHVGDINIDFNQALYIEAQTAAGGIEQLYCNYFDEQYQMLQDLRPAVVGHFDLIRIFDPDYLEQLANTEVWLRIERNLAFIAENNLILDFNLRGFDKTAEQYPSMPILIKALAMNIAVVPGDDSHGCASVGRNFAKGVEILIGLSANTDWQKPQRLQY